jgi:hypothetical protein
MLAQAGGEAVAGKLDPARLLPAVAEVERLALEARRRRA